MLRWIFLLVVFLPHFSLADDKPASSLFIKVGEANLKKSLIAVAPPIFEGAPPISAQNVRGGKEMFDVMNNDLSVSGFFEFIKPDAFLENTTKTGLKPAQEEAGGFQFDSWKKIGAEFLLRSAYRIADNQVSLTAHLYYVPGQKRIFGKTYRGEAKDLRKVAHTLSNDIVRELTGIQPFFTTKLVATRTMGNQVREVFVLDWDGANPKQVSTHRSITVSPSWNSDGTKVVYSAFAEHKNERRRNLDMFTYDLGTGRRLLVSYRKGINSGATVMPRDAGLLLTLSNADAANGNPDIYRMNMNGTDLVRLTNGPRTAMNVEPAMSPDGRKIAFSSDRSGVPMIYTMNAEGGGVERITFAGSYNSSPRWSPDGKKIVFAGYDKDQNIKNGHFDLFLMDADGTNMIRLTSANKNNGKLANNESPSFSPDGRHIVFTSDRSGTNQIYIVSIDGQDERRITFDRFDYSKPNWSPYLD